MARRRKSLNDIVRQAGRISGRITAMRQNRYGNGGSYGDATDVRLRNLENRALSAMTNYAYNIRNTSRYQKDSARMGNYGQNDVKYSSSTYMGLSNG